MTDPLFTPLKSHPSTWQQEVAQLRDENTDLILHLQAMASNGQAAEAHEARLLAEAEAEALRAENARLTEERDRALAWRDKDWQASQDNEALRARVAALKKALEDCFPVLFAVAFGDTDYTKEWAKEARRAARAALQEGGVDD